MCGKKKNTVEKKTDKNNEFSWIHFIRTFRHIWPYVWPSGKPGLQLRFMMSFLIIAINRGLNVLIPIFYKDIVDSLVQHSGRSESNSPDDITDSNMTTVSVTMGTVTTVTVKETQPAAFCWHLIIIFIALKLLSGGGGYLNCLRGLLWVSVLQNAQKKMRMKVFSHIHSLSVKWHQENKRTGAVVTLIDRGVVSMNLIISHLIFNVLPTLADIIIAFIFFVTVLNIWTGLIVFASILGYLVATVVLGEWRTKFKKGMIKADNERSAVFVDSILNYETVKCFTGEETEMNRYEEKIDNIQKWDWQSDSSSKMIMAIQKTMMMSGLLGVSMLAAWYVWTGKFSVGDFVLFASYVEQLYSPLTMFSACYRILQDASLNMEHMLKVLKLTPDIEDGHNTLSVTKGEIQFENVYFQYGPGKTILKDVNFTVPAGKTYAIVGNSGGGKSTLLKLLLRFYDVTMGRILIDGIDIAKVTQKSLRQNLGILPQTATLFNQNINYNIKYSRNTADQTEIETAAKHAQIHDKVLTLSDGYQTKVGENGVKLSGGEKRRVVIARAILEGAQIILLDEATTGLDNKTEHEVWTALERLCATKTTMIVSHQLSHITHADQIVVLKDGQIVEQGTHRELRDLKQYYEELWLIEHPEDNPQIPLSPSFCCTIPNCCCQCHNTTPDQGENTSICSGMECYCNCHDLEVEQEVLAILKQESEEGIPFDDDPSTSEDAHNVEKSDVAENDATNDEMEKSRSRINSNRSDVLLQTIHEVPSTEERDDAFVSDKEDNQNETDPLLATCPLISPNRPKLGDTHQFCFDKEDNTNSASALRKRLAFTKSISLSVTEDDDMKLIISGKSFNIKPKKKFVSDLIDDNLQLLDRSLPTYKMPKRRLKAPLLRSKTVDVPSLMSPSSPPPRTLEQIKNQLIKKQEKLDRAREKERDRAQCMIDEASSVISLLPDDLAMMDSMPDHYDEDTLHPLCASTSVNVSKGLDSFKKMSQSSSKDVSIEMPNY